MGALLAAIAAEQMDDLAALALLAPVGSGKAYARELRALAMMRGLAHRDRSDQLTESGSLEGAGFVYTRQTIKDLQALLPIGSARAPANDILLLHRPNAALDQDFHARLLVCGASVTEAAFPDYPLLVRDADLSVYPRVGFGHVIDWLAELRGATQPLHSEPPASTPLQLGHATETAVFLNSDRNLRGLTCEPHAPAHRPVLVFLNTGAIHHVGASRMTVTMARRLARVGFRSLRLDIGGIGESEPPPGRAANHPLNPAVVEDVRCALDWLQDRGHNECILIGLCSGAKLALETTLQDRRVVGQMLLNLQGFWPAPDSGTETESRRYLERLADRRVRTRFLYVEKDPGLDELQAVFGHDGERLCTIPNVSMTIMHDGDHVFSWYSSRRQLLSLVEHDLMEMLASTQVVRADRNEAAPAEI
jgi:dienelactone hydrolase